MDYGLGLEDRTLSGALQSLDDNNRLVCRSKYYMQIEQYLHWFPKRSIYIMNLDDLRVNPHQAMKNFFRFLEVDDTFASADFCRAHFTSDFILRRTQMGKLFDRVFGTYAQGPVELLPKLLRWWAYWPLSTPLAKPSLEPGLRQRLVDCLKNDVDQLRALTGNRFETWSL